MDSSLCKIHILPQSIRHNLGLLCASGKPLMPVIKANAYGHGLFTVAGILMEQGINHLAVGSVAEAAFLRSYGFTGTIVSLLGAVYEEDFSAILTHNIIPVVHDQPSLARITQAMAKQKAIPVAIKCDTGMARLGFHINHIPALAETLVATPQLSPVLLLSHLAVADEFSPQADAFTRAQASLMANAAAAMRARFPHIRVSLGNSSCLLAFPELAGDLARPGLALYGYNPFEGSPRHILGSALLPAMEVTAPILSVHPLNPGQSFGYGRGFTASQPMLVAIVAVGYANCFRRNSHPQAAMAASGARLPVLGRVSMQMTCVDITLAPHLQPGNHVHILGQGISATQLAQWWDTIPYEVLCLLGKNL